MTESYKVTSIEGDDNNAVVEVEQSDDNATESPTYYTAQFAQDDELIALHPVKMLLETEGKWLHCKCPWTVDEHKLGHWTEHQRWVTPWEKIT